LLFPGNGNHQKIFLAVFIELKYAPQQFLPTLTPLCDKYAFTHRMLETVRSKMRRMGIIDHVSRFNKTHGYREGWVFSNRFSRALSRLAELAKVLRDRKDPLQERKDRDLFVYI
jgi:hypothetical protein